MRIDIKKFAKAGLVVSVEDDIIMIYGPPMPAQTWEALKAEVARAGIKDTAMQEFVLGSFSYALQRAQIMELAE